MCTEKEIDVMLKAAEEKGWKAACDRISKALEDFCLNSAKNTELNWDSLINNIKREKSLN